jgi:SAM-dependent methyltransferase
LNEIYDVGYFRDQPTDLDRHGYVDYVRDAPLHRANARRRLRLLAAGLPQHGRLLDVGSAAGFFVDEARRAGWAAYGIDVSAPMVEWAHSELGLTLMHGSFARASISAATLDAITMWDYIEHSLDPRRDLKKARELLRPGGILALSTGDVGSLSARLTGHHWHLLTPEHHNFFFDVKTLRRLLEETGFVVLEMRHRADRYSIPHALHKLAALPLLGALRGVAQRLARSRLGAAGLPINLYDVVTVVAERR